MVKTQVTWEVRPQGTYDPWMELPDAVSKELEAGYKRGSLYSDGYMYLYPDSPQCNSLNVYPKNPVKMTAYSVTEIYGQVWGQMFKGGYQNVDFRRSGETVSDFEC